MILCNLFQIKVVGIVADIYDYMSLSVQKNKKRNVHKLIFAYICDFCWKKYNYYILLTEKMNDIVNKLNRPYVVIEGFLSSERISELKNISVKSENNKKIVMYSGSIYEEYGIKNLIEAFTLLDRNDCELHLYGNTNMLDYINESISRDSRIKYFGCINLNELLQKQKDAYILVNPRPTNEEYTKYSFPSKTLEYMATGNICVSTKLDGIPNEYDDYLNYFDDYDTNSICDKLNYLLDDKNYDELAKKAKKGAKFVEKNKNDSVSVEKVKKMIDSKDSFVSNDYLKKLSFIISLIFLVFGVIDGNLFLCKLSLSGLFIYILYQSLKNYKIYLPLIFFLIGFFVFTMGQYYFPNVTDDYMYYKNFSTLYVTRTMFIQYIALLMTYCGYNLFFVLDKKSKISVKELNIANRVIVLYKKIILIGLIISFICSLLINIESLIYSMKNGYLSLYDGSFNSIFPFIVKKASGYFNLFFVFSLVFIKNKKVLFTLFGFYVLNSFLIFLGGSRFDFVFAIFFIIFLYLLYYIKNKLAFPKQLKKIFLVGILCSPILLCGLSIYNQTRNDIKLVDINPIKELQSFFISQGRSANLITYAQIYKDELVSEEPYYIFGLFTQSLINKANAISFGLFKIPDLSTNDKLNFAVDISNKVLGENLVDKGHGLGSQYLAELYIEGGLILIIIFSVLFGFAISFLYNNYNSSWLIQLFMLNLISPIMHISRGQTFELISPFLSITNWLLIALLFVGNYAMKKYNFIK